MSQKLQGFTSPDFESVLKSLHRAMKRNNITDEVPVNFRVAGHDECRVWRCRTSASGKIRCRWEPC